MKVQRQGNRGLIKMQHCNFLIYDESKSFDQEASDRRYVHSHSPNLSEELKERMVQNFVNSGKEVLWRKAYGHPLVCFFTVNKDAPTTYEFDSDKKYTSVELKEIMRRSNAAKRRCKWKI